MSRIRVRNGLVMGAALLAATFFLPPVGAVLLIMALCARGQWEFYALLDAARIPNFKIVGTTAGMALIAATWADVRWSGGGRLDIGLLALFACSFLVFVRQFSHRYGERALETMAGTLMGLIYVAFMMSFLLRILMAWGDMRGRWLLFFMIALVKFTDVGAYFIGSRLGRHKLLPRVSPAKTWEGCIGGLLACLGLSLAVFFLSDGCIGSLRMELRDAILLGLLMPVTGIVGDLAESQLKRAAGVKDSGELIAGMGGLLDVIDSLLLSAPVLYFYTRYFLESAG